MADVISEADVERLVSCAKRLVDETRHSSVEVIKRVRLEESCSLAEAKEAFLLATNNETLGQYQERVFLPLIDELDEFEKREGQSLAERENDDGME